MTCFEPDRSPSGGGFTDATAGTSIAEQKPMPSFWMRDIELTLPAAMPVGER